MRHLIVVLATALAVASPISRAQTPTAQPESKERGRTESAHHLHQRERERERETRHIDHEVAIAQALCMSIEGSDLWTSAMKAGAEKMARAAEATPSTGEAKQPAGMLDLYARRAFESSNRLYAALHKEKGETSRGEQALKDDKTCERFQRAAWEYSQALERLCHQKTKEREVAQATEGSRPEVSDPATATLSKEDAAKVVLINYAVKEAVEGVALKKMLRNHNDRDESARALMTNAEQMVTSSRQLLQAIEGSDRPASETKTAEAKPTETKAPEADRPAETATAEPASAATLARLGQEVIDAVERLDHDRGVASTMPERISR